MRKLFLAIALLIGIIANGQNKILFTDSFETYNLAKWSFRDLANVSPPQMTQSSVYAFSGTYSNKVTLNKTDPLVSGNHRAELVWNSQAFSQQTNTGVQWIEFHVLFDPTNVVDQNHPYSIINIHDGEPCANQGTNPQALVVFGNHFEYWVNADTVNYCNGGSANIYRAATFNLGPWVAGQWYSFIVQSNWKADNTGFVRVWRDGVQVVNYTGRSWFANIFTEPYIKFGIYYFGWANETAWGGLSPATTVTIYQDNIRIGSNTASISDFLPVPNVIPVASATTSVGSNPTIYTPQNTITLLGSATDQDGSIVSYHWSLQNFANSNNIAPTIVTPNAQNTGITGLTPGVYTFSVIATDNVGGNSLPAPVSVQVLDIPNIAPTATITSAKTYVIQPANSIVLSSTASDVDGVIASRAWTQVSGPSCTLSGASTSTLTVTNMNTAGDYVFQLRVTDDDGAIVDVQYVINVIAFKSRHYIMNTQ